MEPEDMSFEQYKGFRIVAVKNFGDNHYSVSVIPPNSLKTNPAFRLMDSDWAGRSATEACLCGRDLINKRLSSRIKELERELDLLRLIF